MKQLLLIDSREKASAISKSLEYFDKHGVRWVKTKMLFGDYMDYSRPHLVIDRKQNIAELAKNITAERERFTKEIEWAEKTGSHIVILVEEDHFMDRGERVPVRNISDLLLWSSKHTQVRGEQVFRILNDWTRKKPISVVFCNKRYTAQNIVKIIYGGDFEPPERE